MTITLDIRQLSIEINLSEKTIRSTLTKNPRALPPRLLIPGQKRLLWLRSDVEKFYEDQVRAHGSNPAFSAVLKTKLIPTPNTIDARRKPGRPTKAEYVAARQKEENDK